MIDIAFIELINLSVDVIYRKDEAYFRGGDFGSFKLSREIKVKK